MSSFRATLAGLRSRAADLREQLAKDDSSFSKPVEPQQVPVGGLEEVFEKGRKVGDRLYSNKSSKIQAQLNQTRAEQKLIEAKIFEKSHNVDRLASTARQQEVSLMASELQMAQTEERIRLANELGAKEGAEFEKLELQMRIDAAREKVRALQVQNANQGKELAKLFRGEKDVAGPPSKEGAAAGGDGLDADDRAGDDSEQDNAATSEQNTESERKGPSLPAVGGAKRSGGQRKLGSTIPVKLVPSLGPVTGKSTVQVQGMGQNAVGVNQVIVRARGRSCTVSATSVKTTAMSSEMQALVPSHVEGPIVVFEMPAWRQPETVTIEILPPNSDAWAGEVTSSFAYHSIPEIEEIVPPAASAFLTTTVNIKGKDFDFKAASSDTMVRFVRAVAQTKTQKKVGPKFAHLINQDIVMTVPARLNKEGVLQCEVGPTTTLCRCQLMISFNGGLDFTAAAGSFAFFKPPVVEDFTPSTGVISHRTPVMFRVNPLDHDTGAVKVRFAASDVDTGARVDEIVVDGTVAGNHVHCKSPSFDREVECEVGLSLDGGLKYFPIWGGRTFKVYDTPQVIAATPSCGPSSGGTDITFSGHGFPDTKETVVRFSLAKMQREVKAIYMGKNTIRCRTPAIRMGHGKVDIEMSTNGKHFFPVSKCSFSMFPPYAITGIHPPSVTVRGGQLVTVFGTQWPKGPGIELSVKLTLSTDARVYVLQPAVMNNSKGVVEFVMPTVSFTGKVQVGVAANGQQYETAANSILRVTQHLDTDEALCDLDRRKAADEDRKIAREARARELLVSSKAPIAEVNKEEIVAKAQKMLNEYYAAAGETFQPKINAELPDFAARQERWEASLAKRKASYKEAQTKTKTMPFKMRTDKVSRLALQRNRARYERMIFNPACVTQKHLDDLNYKPGWSQWDIIQRVWDLKSNVMTTHDMTVFHIMLPQVINTMPDHIFEQEVQQAVAAVKPKKKRPASAPTHRLQDAAAAAAGGGADVSAEPLEAEEEGQAIYEGDRLEDDSFQGQGTLTLPSGDVYKGQFHRGKMHGQGTWEYANGDTFEGFFELGHASGEGTYKSNSGDVYNGEYGSNGPSGKGTKVWSDGRRYEGMWAGGVQHGSGVFTDPTGMRYEGEFVGGKAEGHGMLKASNGHVYTGEWRGGKEWGNGRCQWKDGRVYEGGWMRGKISGNGVMHWPDGSKYQGDWERGKRHGHGRFIWADGSSYDGDWESGKAAGVGVYTRVDGSRYEGHWAGGVAQGQGRFTQKSGHTMEGVWNDGTIAVEDAVAMAQDDDEKTVIKQPKPPAQKRSSALGAWAAVRLTKNLRQGGVGMKLQTRTRDKSIIISKLANGGPAEQSSRIKAGDVLVSVDGHGVQGVNLKVVAGMLAGTTGTDVALGVSRGTDPSVRTVKLTRAAKGDDAPAPPPVEEQDSFSWLGTVATRNEFAEDPMAAQQREDNEQLMSDEGELVGGGAGAAVDEDLWADMMVDDEY